MRGPCAGRSAPTPVLLRDPFIIPPLDRLISCLPPCEEHQEKHRFWGFLRKPRVELFRFFFLCAAAACVSVRCIFIYPEKKTEPWQPGEGITCASQGRRRLPLAVACRGFMVMGKCLHSAVWDRHCKTQKRYHSGEAFILFKGRGGLFRLCVNNSWVYMVQSIQIDTICFPIR